MTLPPEQPLSSMHATERENGNRSGDSEIISLTEQEKKPGNLFNVTDQISYGTFELKSQLARWLVWIFAGTNLFVAGLVAFLAWLDLQLITVEMGYSKERLINHTVIMALIGATTVQVGIIAVSLFGSLFPKDR